jgi:hypothetical protein
MRLAIAKVIRSPEILDKLGAAARRKGDRKLDLGGKGTSNSRGLRCCICRLLKP